MGNRMKEMPSMWSYLLPAAYQRLVDYGSTRIYVNVIYEVIKDQLSPAIKDKVKDGVLVLSIGPAAAPFCEFKGEFLNVGVRFGGVPYTLNINLEAVFAVYDPDNFDESFFGLDQPPPGTIKIEGAETPKKPTLTVVKNNPQ